MNMIASKMAEGDGDGGLRRKGELQPHPVNMPVQSRSP